MQRLCLVLAGRCRRPRRSRVNCNNTRLSQQLRISRRCIPAILVAASQANLETHIALHALAYAGGMDLQESTGTI
jgi:hypothetical protein